MHLKAQPYLTALVNRTTPRSTALAWRIARRSSESLEVDGDGMAKLDVMMVHRQSLCGRAHSGDHRTQYAAAKTARKWPKRSGENFPLAPGMTVRRPPSAFSAAFATTSGVVAELIESPARAPKPEATGPGATDSTSTPRGASSSCSPSARLWM